MPEKPDRFSPFIRDRFDTLGAAGLATMLALAVAATPAVAGMDEAGEPLKLRSSTQSVIHGPPDVSPTTHSVARLWNEELLAAIRRDTPRPTVHARNLFHVSAAMYDAWAAYSAEDLAVFHTESKAASPASLPDARRTAVSHAAYRLLSHRFANSPGQPETQAGLDALMELLELDADDDSTQGDSPVALGNRVADSLIEHGLQDGSNQPGNYQDTTGYNPVNIPMTVAFPGTGGLADPDAWQPLIPPEAFGVQNFLSPHWRHVSTFALERPAADTMFLDPGPPPLLDGTGTEMLKDHVLALIEASSRLDPADGQMLNISPGEMGNNPLGTNDGTGHPVNPATGEPYSENLVLRADWYRVLAEFWEDGPMSSTPPGHWNEIANEVSDHLGEDRRIGGTGPVVDDLEWDVKLYLALNGAAHDSAIATWEVKRVYNSSRPITLIRGMSEYGQSSAPELPNHDPRGLPLEPGLVELVTPDSSAPGERHEHLADHVNEIAIVSWQGHPDDPDSEIGGTGWIRGVEWLPYQARGFVTPPFAGYTSGHSGFSRAAAEVLSGFTGSPYFPGGMGEYLVSADGDFSLRFEHGPAQEVRLQWATYFDAADEAGLSRIYGGIHPEFDDLPGRVIGHQAGIGAFEEAMAHFGPVAATGSDPVSIPAWSRPGLLLTILAILGLALLQRSGLAKW